MSRDPGMHALCAGLRRTAAIVLLAGWPVFGHSDVDEGELLNGVVLVEARVEVSPGDGKVRLFFTISNSSGRTIVLEGIRSLSGDTGELFLNPRGAVRQPVEQLVIPDQETLELGTSHIRAELALPASKLDAGDLVQFELVFRSGTIIASAHVHAGGEQPNWSSSMR